MSKIQTFLQNILTARYGKDVRQSIHDAIQEIDSVADTAKDSATAQAEEARKSAQSASNSASAAAVSEDNARTYMQYANASATNAKASEEASKLSETNSKTSETNAKLSEEHAQAVFESLPEDYGTLSKEFYEVAIKQKASGEEIHVDDSANAKVREFALFGKAKQNTTSGKNLIDVSTVVSNYELPNPLQPGTYTLSFKALEANSGGFRLSNSTDTSIDSVVNTNSKNSDGYVVIKLTTNFVANYINISSGSGSTAISEVMLSEGDTYIPYEPYTNGPSPNPQYPQEISVATNPVVKSCGAQLFDVNKLIGSSAKVEINGDKLKLIASSDGAYRQTMSLTILDLEPNVKTILNISVDKVYNSNSEHTPFIIVRLINPQNASDYVSVGNINVTGKINANFEIEPNEQHMLVKIIVCMNKSTTALTNEYCELTGLMVNYGSTPLPYQPYKETTATIPVTDFAGIPVTSGGNYTDSNGQQWICDEVVKYADGSGEKVKNTYYLEVTEEMINNAVYNETTNRFSFSISFEMAQNLPDGQPSGFCNFAKVLGVGSANSTHKNSVIIRKGSDIISVYVWADGVTDKESFMALNPKFLFNLGTPIRTPLTAEEIAEIEKLSMFNPVTNISNGGDCGMNVTYLADCKNYIDKRLAQIEQALVNNI